MSFNRVSYSVFICSVYLGNMGFAETFNDVEREQEAFCPVYSRDFMDAIYYEGDEIFNAIIAMNTSLALHLIDSVAEISQSKACLYLKSVRSDVKFKYISASDGALLKKAIESKMKLPLGSGKEEL